MKKIFLLLMFVAPLAVLAQRDAQGGVSKADQSGSGAEVYMTMALTENQGQIGVKLDFGKVISEIATEKMLLVEIEDLQRMRFTSIVEAMNTLASYGWEIEESYTVETRTGALTFIVFAKEVARLKKAQSASGSKPSLESKGKTPAKK